MGLDGYYRCTIIQKAAQIGRDQTRREVSDGIFKSLIMHIPSLLHLGRAPVFFLMANEARRPILLVF